MIPQDEYYNKKVVEKSFLFQLKQHEKNILQSKSYIGRSIIIATEFTKLISTNLWGVKLASSTITMHTSYNIYNKKTIVLDIKSWDSNLSCQTFAVHEKL